LNVTFPKKIQIETTIHCNGKCTFCPQKDVTREPAFMEEKLIHKIIDETRGQGIIYRPFLLNEPFCDKRLPDVIRYIKQDKSAVVELNSNGGVVTDAFGKAVIEAGLDVIRFSLDAFSPEVYDKSGRGDRYEKVKENIIRFIENKNRINPALQVSVRMIDMDINKHEQKPYTEFWAQYADDVNIVPLYDYPWTVQDSYLPLPCPKIRDEMFFYVDGRAVLCCWDYAARGVIGNIRENSVSEIWNGEINQKYRALLNEGKRGEITLCSRCDAFGGYNFDNWSGY